VSVKLADKEYAHVMRAPESALYGEDTVYIVQDDRLVDRRVAVVGYSGTDILFREQPDYPIADGELIVTTQIREGGAGARVAVR
jgi:multidrug efflux pump subunit AcrA (membrane-fusion protein)